MSHNAIFGGVQLALASMLLLAAFAIAAAPLPCDVYEAAGTPCVAAHSVVRALYKEYTGALYTVRRADNATKDIGVVGGFADSTAQDAFCEGTTCTIDRVLDQSKKLNHLTSCKSSRCSKQVNATKDKLTVGGHSVYSAYFEGEMGYRNDKTTGIATGDEAESIYMVASGTHYSDKCCFDYG